MGLDQILRSRPNREVVLRSAVKEAVRRNDAVMGEECIVVDMLDAGVALDDLGERRLINLSQQFRVIGKTVQIKELVAVSQSLELQHIELGEGLAELAIEDLFLQQATDDRVQLVDVAAIDGPQCGQPCSIDVVGGPELFERSVLREAETFSKTL